MCNNMISILTNISNILKDVHIVPNLKNNDLTFCKFIQILNTLVPSKLLKSHIFKMFTMAKQKNSYPLNVIQMPYIANTSTKSIVTIS